MLSTVHADFTEISEKVEAGQRLTWEEGNLRLRPGAPERYYHNSQQGFMGRGEDFRAVLMADNDWVTDFTFRDPPNFNEGDHLISGKRTTPFHV